MSAANTGAANTGAAADPARPDPQIAGLSDPEGRSAGENAATRSRSIQSEKHQ